MNKLNTDVYGGFPLDLDDFGFIDSSIRESFFGWLSAFGVTPDTSFIISGCRTTTPGAYGPGYLAFNGEILKVDGGSLPAVGIGQVLAWNKQTTATNPKQTETGSTVNTYLVTKGIVEAITPSGPYLPYNAPGLFDVIGVKMASIFVNRGKYISNMDLASLPQNVANTPVTLMTTALGITSAVPKLKFTVHITVKPPVSSTVTFSPKVQTSSGSSVSRSYVTQSTERQYFSFSGIVSAAAGDSLMVSMYSSIGSTSIVEECIIVFDGFAD